MLMLMIWILCLFFELVHGLKRLNLPLDMGYDLYSLYPQVLIMNREEETVENYVFEVALLKDIKSRYTCNYPHSTPKSVV